MNDVIVSPYFVAETALFKSLYLSFIYHINQASWPQLYKSTKWADYYQKFAVGCALRGDPLAGQHSVLRGKVVAGNLGFELGSG